MDTIKYTNDGLVIQSDYFDMCSTILSGQCFRYYKTEKGYDLISQDKKCSLRQAGNRTFIQTNHSLYFYNYFDLATDYEGIVKSLCADTSIKQDVLLGRGIHILRQDLLETIISFIISANNNIPRIKGIIQRLCQKFGRAMDGFYAFPTLSQLQDAKIQDYKDLGAGYRAEYLQSTVRQLSDTDILHALPHMDYDQSVKALTSLKGVGRKVADCICLFALYHTQCYPVDTWIKKADGLSQQEAIAAAKVRYKDLAGYAQQYKFYAARLRNNKLV